MAFCAKCGSQLAEGAAFCGACGAPIGATASAPGAEVSTGIAPNVAALLAYFPFVGWIISIVFLVAESFKADQFVRFHAFQSIFFNVVLVALWIVYTILSMILGIVSLGVLAVVMGLLGLLVFLAALAYTAFLMYKGYKYEKYMIPFIGPLAAKQVIS